MSGFETAVLSAVMSGAKMAQQQSAAKKQAAQVESQRRADIAAINQKQEIEERQRREQLRRDQAAQRARFAGRGISAGSGSAASLISGLARQVDDTIATQRAFNNLSIGSIDSNAATQWQSLLSKSKTSLFNSAIGFVDKHGSKLPSLFDGK